MSPPPPPPPPTDGEMMTMAMPMMTTPPPRQRKQHTGSSKSPVASPATSASSLASPTHVTKARMAADLMSPRMRGRMDPYPRYSPRKRLSADYSDGTYSVGSGAESPRSEKGGWRIHAAVAGPFLTGPLAREFRGEDFKSPRGKKKEEPDFDNNLGLLLFPVVPAFVPPAISPEVFQAAMNPAPAAPALTLTAAATQETTPAPPAETFAQQEAENDYVAPQATTESAEWNQNQTYDQASYQEYQQGYDQAAYDQAAYDQAAYDEYYQNQQHYAADQYNYAGYDQQQYGYDNYYAEAYHYQQTYESQEYVATEEHQQVAPSTTSEEAFPPLPHHEAEATVAAVETPVEAPAPSSPARRERAPSYADIVTGAAHSAPSPSPRKEVAKSPKKDPSQQIFEDMSAGIAESVNRILAKSKGKKTHSEIEFACLIQKISTQLKLMGKVSTSLKLEQAKTLHKLQKAEAEKTSIEASNAEMAALVKQYEQERDALKVQLAEALEAKDARLKDAVQQLTSKIDALKSSKDASSAKIASEIDAIRSCGNPDDLEKRVDEIGQVLAHLIKSQSEAKPAPVARRPSNMDGRRQSIGSWKAVALYAIIVWAASLCGVWIGVKYVASQPPLVNTPQPLALQDADLDLIMARLSEKYPSVETSRDDIAEVVAEVAAPVAPTSSNNDVVEVAVLDDASIAAVPNTWTEVTETVATVEATPVENVAPVQRTSSTASCSPLSHVMYAWRPSFFEMAGTQDGSALNGLARALTSLSSQILSNHEETVVAASEPSVFEVVEDNTSSEPVAEITPVEQPIDDVSGSVIELADVAATEEIVAPVEIAEPVVATEENVAVVEPVVAVVEEVAVTEAVNVSQPYAWELVAPEVVLPTVEEMLSSTPAAVDEIVEEVEVVEAVEEVVAEPEVMEAAVEVVQVVEEEEVVVVAPVEQVVEVVEAVSSNWVLPVETSAAPSLQFSNASEVVVAKAELETLAVDGMCSVPALDLRSHLL